MACDDRQLTEAQRQAGYQQQRTGVQRALRPFTGTPSLPNLLDYINRELVPALRQTRDAVNDVYLPVVDNAPSANPLQYYFSTDTTNADPTTGFVRLNASPQDTATIVRVSETNARLGDARPWLEVMAGGVTTPLGVVTLSDAVNPARFIRFDLNTMTDQGSYWDLGVTSIESSHDDPFVNGGGLVMSFIPGVASTGTTVPPGSLSPIGPNTLLGNPTASTAPPVEIAIDDLGVAGRKGLAGTGNLESITVPDTSVLTGESVFLRSPSARTSLQFRNFTLGDLPLLSNNRFIGNVSGATSRPIYTDLAQLGQDLFGIGFDAASHNWKLSDIITDHFLANISGATTTPIPIPLSSIDSTSIIYDGTTHTFQRAALTGDVTSAQNSNTVTVNTSAITNAKLANMAAGTVKGRQIDASTGVPVDLSGAEVSELIRYATTQAETLAATTNDLALAADTTVLRVGSVTGSQTLTGITGGVSGRTLIIENTSSGGTNITLASLDAGSLSANRFRTPNGVALVLRFRESALLRWDSSNGDWRFTAIARATAVADADYGDITVSSAGSVWTIDAAAVTLAKMANLAAGTTIGRQTDAATGVPVALTGTEIGENLRLDTRVDDASTSGTSSPYTPVAADTNWIRFTALTGLYTLNGVDNSTSGRIFFWHVEPGATGSLVLTHNSGLVSTGFRFFCPGAVDLTLTSGMTAMTVFTSNRHRVVSVSRHGFALTDADKGDITVTASGATWTIDNDVVSDAKLRNSAALSVIGRSANSTGDPADIAAANDGEVLRRSGTALGFGTVATAGIANNAVTNAKIRQGAALTVIGVAGNATADVADIGAGVDGYVLRRIGTALGFGPIATAGIDDNQVTNAKIRDSGALSVIGRSANSSGDPADISAVAASGAVLRESGSTVGFGTVAAAGLASDAVTTVKILDANVTLAKMANLAQSTIIGRAEGAGTGVPTALTPTQIVAIIDGEAVTWTAAHSFTGATHTVNATGAVSIASSGSTVSVGGGTQTILAAGTTIDANSPTRLQSSTSLTSVLTSASTAANDLAIGSVGVVRFTGPIDPLTGMVAAATGQVVLLVNAHATVNMGVHLESASSTAANRFAGVGTSRFIKAGEMALAWYDGSSSRWRLLLRDDVDL